ncbi:hypothetical protein HNR12_002201 [Streptomonospora nanhaiensis]|uniref:Uncharacterized protein n=1 Tax=Streptomonospora nanhaiensis TaxID=1323731 RepID=A0A853BMK1_9ACTN|nr:hypothetical protein [Streptomonospora nanhaiensis]NYI95924.1 hypothetical protein [Streptomonospora nanhaiensis]
MIPQPKKIWPAAAMIVFVLFVVQSPEAAARIVSGTFGLLSTAADAVGVFVETL